MARGKLHARYFTLFFFVLAGSDPSPAQDGHESWSYNLAVYEINIRNFTQGGTFAAAETHLDRLDELGVGIIWLMPVYPIGVENRLGSVGSPYSVQNYLEVNPQYGTRADLESFVDAAHERGMYVLLDWVANHTSWDNVLTEEHPEWYVTEDGSFISPPGTNWSDVIELDYSKPGLRSFMIDAMRFWVEEVGVDGFRFDAVDFVPMDFWEDATAALKETRPDLFLLAEGQSPTYHDAGFDATHAWSFYGFGAGLAKRVADGAASAFAFSGFVEQEDRSYPEDAYRLFFTSNHDENAWHGTPSELFGPGTEVFAVLTATLDGFPLIYMGQEAGLDRRLAFFDRDPIIWRAHENESFYRTLLTLKRQNRALWSGTGEGNVQWIRTNVNGDVFGFRRESGENRVIVFTNLSDEQHVVSFDAAAFAGTYRDVFTDDAVGIAPNAEIVLDAWSYLVLVNRTETSIEDPVENLELRLVEAYPNPAATAAWVEYALPTATNVRIVLFDMLGRELQTLVSGQKSIGRHKQMFDVARLPAGMYFAVLDSETWTDQVRFAVIR